MKSSSSSSSSTSLARIFLTLSLSLSLSLYPSLSSIAPRRSSKLHILILCRVCCKSLLIGHTGTSIGEFACEFVLNSSAVHSMSVFLYRQFARWSVNGLFSCYFVGCCFQDSFKIASSILVQLPSDLFSFVRVQVAQLYWWNKYGYNLEH